jgi:hypothetical protein
VEDKEMINDCWAKLSKSEGERNTNVNLFFDKNETGYSRSLKVRATSPDGEVVEEFVLVQRQRDIKIYRNERKSREFTKEGCSAPTERGETLEYIVPYGKYTSIVSQEDADNKALEDIENNGQRWVNENGVCKTVLWYNKRQEKTFTKNDCNPDTEVGSDETMVIEAGAFSSTISQEDADNKAANELNTKGQNYANSHGHCTTIKWYNKEKKKLFQKTDCLVTEVGSFVEYVVPAKMYSSTISQEDADEKALDDLELNGPSYANEHGICAEVLWYSERQSKVFTKNDCELGYIGTDYEYIVEAGKYSSEVSQEDANRQALEDIEANGQEQANLNAECIDDPNFYRGKASKEFTKNDCGADYYGSTVIVTQDDVTGGPFTSTVSQADADSKAMAAVEAQGQSVANQKGECTAKPVYTGVAKKTFTKNNCDTEAVGSEVEVTQNDVTGGPFTTTESQEAADALAMAAIEAQGQDIANSRGVCTWTGRASQEFQKNDCEEGQQGSTITVDQDDVTGGPFTSTVSQADADAKAMASVQAQGQAIANAAGNCNDIIVYTGRYSAQFTPNCEECHTGVPMTVTQNEVGGPFTSTISQEDADAKAKAAVEAGGQGYANKNGVCNPDSKDPVWEDAVPEELRCSEGKSQKKQKNTNKCSDSYNSERWVDGGNKTCQWRGTYSEVFQRNDCAIADSGSEVEVDETKVEGYPFISFVSQEDANNKAMAAVKAQGQAYANVHGVCKFVGKYSKQFAKDNCGTCQHGIPITVTQDNVGGPFYSMISQEDADRQAREAVEAGGQAYANKNGECELDSTDPVWVDSNPLETRCQNGVSQKKQVNTNSCCEGESTRWIDGGGLTCTWTGEYHKQFTKVCDGTGVGSTITVDETMVTGGPFISTVSQEDANNKAKAAVEAQGQNIANSQGTCTWTGKASKSFQRNNCATCYTGSTVTVNQDQVGGPFTSTVSQADADAKALAAVNANGQAVANKNGDCVEDNRDATWTDTGSTQCNGCSSEKQQRDTNSCSSSYNTTKWVSGGGRDCSTNGSWGSWSYSCDGCTYVRTRSNSCGGSETNRTSNSSDCGSWSEQPWGGDCSGTYSIYYERNSCSGSTRESRRVQVDGQCGYSSCTTSWIDTGNTRCQNGTSQKEQYDSCNSSNKRWISGGTACTATNTERKCKSGCLCDTCVEAGSVSGSGSTTSAAQADANNKAQTQANNMTCKTDCYTLEFINGSNHAVGTFDCYTNRSDVLGIKSQDSQGNTVDISKSGDPEWLRFTIVPVGGGIPLPEGYQGSTHLATASVTDNGSGSHRDAGVTITQSVSGKTITYAAGQNPGIKITGTVKVLSQPDVNHFKYLYDLYTPVAMNRDIYFGISYISGGYCQVSAYVKLPYGQTSINGTITGWREANMEFGRMFFYTSTEVPKDGNCGYDQTEACWDISGVKKV